MEQDGQIETAAFVAYIATEKSYHKRIRALNDICMEESEQKRLQNICCYKRHSLDCVFHGNAAENQFLADGGNQDGINSKHQGNISKSDAFH